jgi:hypothetical protein
VSEIKEENMLEHFLQQISPVFAPEEAEIPFS